jgi:hypothetical protein
MFKTRFFATRFFGTRFFGLASGDVVTPPGPTPGTWPRRARGSSIWVRR